MSLAGAAGVAGALASAVASLAYFTGERRIARAEQLPGGLQNVNYKVVTAKGEVVVVRIPSVDAREHGQSAATVHGNAAAAGACGVGPQVCAFDPSSGVIVARFLEGRVLSPSDFLPAPPASSSPSTVMPWECSSLPRHTPNW